MFKKSLIVLLVLIVMGGLIACGKKEAQQEAEAPAEAAKPAVVPGEMVLIPAGEFTFGTNNKDSIAYPEQKGSLPAYWIDKYEVTNYEFMKFSINNSYAGEGAKEGKDWRLFFTQGKENVPVMYISWNDALAYCKAQGKRLPTEEEWEKAARGPSGFAYPWGNEWKENEANTYEAGMVKASDAGQFNDVSPYGVHDMLGNVQEWTGSWYVTYKGNPKKDSKSGKTLRVVRGLSYQIKGKLGNLAERGAQQPESLYYFGCRCAKDATPVDIAKAAPAK